MFEGLMNRLKSMPKEAILTQMGEGLAFWIMNEGITMEDLQRRLDAGEPLLQQALATIPPDDVSRIRQVAARWVSALGPDDYPKILQALADHPECLEHAHLLSQPYYFWKHLVPSMDEAKRWFTTPTAGS